MLWLCHLANLCKHLRFSLPFDHSLPQHFGEIGQIYFHKTTDSLTNLLLAIPRSWVRLGFGLGQAVGLNPTHSFPNYLP